LTYTLGAMKPETAKASVVTADATAKQLALNKVSENVLSRIFYLCYGYDVDLVCVNRYPSRQYCPAYTLLIFDVVVS